MIICLYLIVRGEQTEKIPKHPNTKLIPIFQMVGTTAVALLVVSSDKIYSLFSTHYQVQTNNHQNGLSDISYKSSFSRDLKKIKKCPKSFPSVGKNRFEIFDFSFYFEQIKQANRLSAAELCLI